MPPLTKKRKSTFKAPLLTMENIVKIVQNKDDKSLSKNSNKTENALVIKRRTKGPLLKGTQNYSSNISIHLSFENATDSEDKSDLSYRMNEPKVKEAYIQFVKRLSQSSADESRITSSPIGQQKIHNQSSFMEASPPKTTLKKVKSINASESKLTDDSPKGNRPVTRKKEVKYHSKTETLLNKNDQSPIKKSDKTNVTNKTQGIDILTSNKNNYPNLDLLSLDSGVCLSQEVLNQKVVKDAYVEYMKLFLECENDMIEIPSKVQKKKKNLIDSSLVETKRATRSEKVKLKKKKMSKKNDKEMQSDEEDLYKNLTLEEKMNLIHESRNVGLYALCDLCDKARYLPHIKDPLELPDKWYCAMNPDENYNNCTDPELIMEDKEFLIDNLYNAGSIVWAKMDGFPWWPAMVEDDPDVESYFWLEETSLSPTWYHVTFFDSTDVTRAWIRPSKIRPFKINMYNVGLLPTKKNKYRSKIEAASKQAAHAIDIPLIERLRTYGFLKRFNMKHLKKTCKSSRNSLKSVKTKQKSSKNQKSNLRNGDKTKCNIHTPEIASDKGSRVSNISMAIDNINWLEDENLSFNLFD